MKSIALRSMLLCFCFFLLNSGTIFPDKIALKNGNDLEGTITSEDDDSVSIDIDGGTAKIPRDRIKNIKYEKLPPKPLSQEEEYLKSRDELRNVKNYEQLLILAKKAMEEGLGNLASQDFEFLLSIDNKEIANEAGKILSGLLKNYPIVIFGFKNDTINPEIDALARGLTAMVTDDLQKIGNMKIYERKRIAELIEEINFGASGYIDPTTASKHGKIKGARLAIAGEISKLGNDLNISFRIINIETSKILFSSNLTGTEDKIFTLEKHIAKELLNGLNTRIDKTKLSSVQASDNPKSTEAVKLFGKSLYLYESGKAEKAKPLAESAANIAPDFYLATDLLNEISTQLNKVRILNDTVASAKIETLKRRVEEAEKKPSWHNKYYAWHNLGREQMTNNLPHDAIHSFKNAIKWCEYVQLFIIWESSRGGYIGIRLTDPSIETRIGIIEEVDEEGPAYKAGVRRNDRLISFNGVKIKNNVELESEVAKLGIRSVVFVQWIHEDEDYKEHINTTNLEIIKIPVKTLAERTSYLGGNSGDAIPFHYMFRCLYSLKKYQDILTWGKIYTKAFTSAPNYHMGLIPYLNAVVQLDNGSSDDKGIGVTFFPSLEDLKIGGVAQESLKGIIPENATLLKIDGKPIKNYLDFKKIIRGYQVGEKINITIKTSEGTKEVEVEVIKNPPQLFETPNDVYGLRLR